MGRKSRLKSEKHILEALRLPGRDFEEFVKARASQNLEGLKMSEALLELVEPLMGEIEELDDFKNLISLAYFGWTLSLLDDRSGARLLQDMKGIDTPDSDFYHYLVSLLAARKQFLFPDDKRFILDWEATVRADGNFHLRVESSPLE
jgi:hypothetical protein